jgi:hypothetical protein
VSYDDEDESLYADCSHCGKSVFAGVAECPYCFKDPGGEDFPCARCGKALPTGAAECPYCKSYTGDVASDGGSEKKSAVLVIGALLLVAGVIAALLLMR